MGRCAKAGGKGYGVKEGQGLWLLGLVSFPPQRALKGHFGSQRFVLLTRKAVLLALLAYATASGA